MLRIPFRDFEEVCRVKNGRDISSVYSTKTQHTLAQLNEAIGLGERNFMMLYPNVSSFTRNRNSGNFCGNTTHVRINSSLKGSLLSIARKAILLSG